MNHLYATPRRGFTLVELLMVIVIIGILAALTLVGVMKAMGTGKDAGVLAEINQFGQAMEAYRECHLTYPPSMGTIDENGPRGGGNSLLGYTETAQDRERRFMRHLAKAFPKFRQAVVPTSLNPPYNFNRVPLTYDNVRAQLLAATATYPPNANRPIGANLDNLDAAESLVFWLGGLPDWSSERIVSGFSTDPKNPFWKPGEPNNVPQGEQRMEPFFQFDPTRLVDRDNDGWPEYVPKGTPASGEMAPYVYFDANSYRLGAHYPTFAGHAPSQIRQIARDELVPQWGVAMPYHRLSTNVNLNPREGAAAGTFDPTDPDDLRKIPWVNEKDYQIFAAGQDGVYASPDNLNLNIFRMYPFPQSTMKGLNPAVFDYIYDFDADNLSNFDIKQIGKAELKQPL